MPILIIYGCFLLLILACMKLPYGYYSFLRIVLFIFFLIAANDSYRKSSKYLPWIFSLIAILYNPVLKIHFVREVWQYINVFTAVILLITSRKIRSN